MRHALLSLCLVALAACGGTTEDHVDQDDRTEMTASGGETPAPASEDDAQPLGVVSEPDAESGVITLSSGVTYQDLVIGDGPEAAVGKYITCHCTGWLADGSKFWSSHDGQGQPFSAELRAPNLIQGWIEGIPGMKVGGKRKLWIPSALAYGTRGRAPSVPPNSDLTFEVELLGVR